VIQTCLPQIVLWNSIFAKYPGVGYDIDRLIIHFDPKQTCTKNYSQPLGFGTKVKVFTSEINYHCTENYFFLHTKWELRHKPLCIITYEWNNKPNYPTLRRTYV